MRGILDLEQPSTLRAACQVVSDALANRIAAAACVPGGVFLIASCRDEIIDPRGTLHAAKSAPRPARHHPASVEQRQSAAARR